MIWVDRQGRAGLFPQTNGLGPSARGHSLCEKGCAVIVADLFGQGKFTRRQAADKQRLNKSKACPDKEQWGEYAGYTFGYNPPLFCQRVHDILSLVAYAHEGDGDARQGRPGRVGRGGPLGSPRPGPSPAGPSTGRSSTRPASASPTLTATDDPDFLPGGAKYDDLPGMLALTAPHPLWLAGEDAAAVALVSAAYRAAGRAGELTVWQGTQAEREAAVAQWLSTGSGPVK